MLTQDSIITPEEYLDYYQKTIILPCHLNLALCLIRTKCFDLANKHSSAVLEIDANNEKGLYRHGICNTYLKNFKIAFETLSKGKQLFPSNKSFDEAISNLKNLKAKSDERQKKMNIAMMSGISVEENEPSKSILQVLFQKVQYSIIYIKQKLNFCRRRKIIKKA